MVYGYTVKFALIRKLNLQNVYNEKVHHESIFRTAFFSYPESLRYVYYKCLNSCYFKLHGTTLTEE